MTIVADFVLFELQEIESLVFLYCFATADDLVKVFFINGLKINIYIYIYK